MKAIGFYQTNTAKSLVSRSDLILLLNELGENGLKKACASACYYESTDEESPKRPQEDLEKPPPLKKSQLQFVVDKEQTFFWYPHKVNVVKKTVDAKPGWYQTAKPYTQADFYPKTDSKPPPHQDLCPWRRLWPFLCEALGVVRTGNNIDLPKTVQRIAESKPIRRLPMQKRLEWARRCLVLLDFDKRLFPFRTDIRRLYANLCKIRGKNGLEAAVVTDGPLEEMLYQRDGDKVSSYFRMPEVGTPVLIISDLGLFASSEKERNAWMRFGEKLRRVGLAPIVLTPAPRRIWEHNLTTLYKMVCWDHTQKIPRFTGAGTKGLQPLNSDKDKDSAGIQTLKTLLAPAIRVEPHLLRAARLLLPFNTVDAGHEAAVWNHTDVVQTYTGFFFRTEAVAKMRNRFKTDIPKELQTCLFDLIQAHHRHLSPAVTAEEKMIADLLRHGRPSKSSERYFQRSAKTLSETNPRQWPGLSAWLQRIVVQRQDRHLWQSEAMAVIWALTNRDDWVRGKIESIPQGLPPERINWVLAPKNEPEIYTLYQQGEKFVFKNRLQPNDQTAPTAGSPVIDMVSSDGILRFRENKAKPEYAINLRQPEPATFKIPNDSQLQLFTNHTEVTLQSMQKPPWAKGWGRDEKGLFLILAHGEQTHRTYWLAPGKYPVSNVTEVNFGNMDTGVYFDTANPLFEIEKGFWWDEPEFDHHLQHGFQRPEWADNFGLDRYGLYADFRVDSVVQRMRWIMPGEFMMGSPETETEPERLEREKQHKVIHTQGFWMAETACTQALWQAVMGDNPSRFKGDGLPVENVSWEDAQQFIQTINSRITDLDLHLPTEAQWEFACRAGTTTPFHFGENITTDQVNFNGNYPYNKGEKGEYRKKTIPVKSFACNDWGLYEMHGNVWEWCADWYGEYPDNTVVDPVGPNKGTVRVLRGGSWFFYGRYVRSAIRHRYEPGCRFHSFGFRLARGQTASQPSGGAGQSKPSAAVQPSSPDQKNPSKKSDLLQRVFKK